MPTLVAVIEALMGPTIGLVIGAWRAEFLAWFAGELIGLPARIVNKLRNKYGKRH